VPALPSSILEPLWVQIAALLPDRQVHHPLGCHRPRIPDRLVFDKLIQILVFGCGYRRIADASCSATTLRRRRDEWISAGVAEQLRHTVLAAYDRLFGLELEHLAVDGCITKAPCGGQTAGPSPVDRRKQGLKRSVATEARGIPLVAVPAPANHRDDGLLAATLDAVGLLGPLPQRPTVQLDAGYDYQPCRQVLSERGMAGQIATRGVPAPIQADRRWVIERTHAWWSSPLEPDTSDGRMSVWQRRGSDDDASSPRSSNVTRWSWSERPAGRSRTSPLSWGSTTPHWATGSGRPPSTGASKTG
jgi:transposase